MKRVHFFFLDIGLGTLDDHPEYLKNIDTLAKYNPRSDIYIWDEPKLDSLVKTYYPKLKTFWDGFPSTFYKIDFGRYLVLKKFGGMYLDLDMECQRPLPKENQMDFINTFVDDNGRETFNNNVIYFRDHTLYDKLIRFCQKRFKNNKMPLTWKRRRLLHTVGARMFHKFCSDEGQKKTNVDTYLKDEMTKSWLKVDV